MVVSARVPPELRGRVFRGSAMVQRGVLTVDELRSAPWVRLFRDVYVHTDVPVTHALRVRAAAGVLRPDAVVTGVSAAVLWGVDLAGPADDVEITLPPGVHPLRVPGVRARRGALDPAHVCTHRGVRVTDPDMTTVALAATLPLDDAVIAIDRMTVRGPASLPAVRALAGAMTGRGCRRARLACSLADGKAESPQETRIRLLLGRNGFPAPIAQFPVERPRRRPLRLDFAWPDRLVALEYDGAWHGEPGQLARDRRRLNVLTDSRWRIVFATAADVHRPAEMFAHLRGLLAV